MKYQKLLDTLQFLKLENKRLKEENRQLRNKIELFMSQFRGREDIHAVRWENRASGKTGYTPVCLNRRKNTLWSLNPASR